MSKLYPTRSISLLTDQPVWAGTRRSTWLLCAFLGAATAGIPGGFDLPVNAQTQGGTQAATLSATEALLDKAKSLESRGRMDMAAQTWQQVLLADPNNVSALAGLARAAKLSGNTALSNSYIDRLKAINPNDPNIERIRGMLTQQTQTAELQQAGKYAQAGQYAQAMNIYRQVFGSQPPPGDWALAYYETESATDNGRAHAIAGLRSLVEQYPADSRYQITLGRILTYDPKTREEGRKMLERYPNDSHAVEALRQSLVWDSQNPASASDIRNYLMKHNDAQLSTALKNQPKVYRPAAALTPAQAAANARERQSSLQIEAAYRALNGKHIEEAEQRFKEILANDPESARALAGMGYVRMQQSNFGGAISFLEQAQQDGARDPGLENALSSARFYYTMSQGSMALNQDDLTTAEKEYQAALAMRPTSPEALEGLGGTLMKAQQPAVAEQVFERYVKVKPSAPAAWRGLMMAEYGAGSAPLAIQTETRIPSAVRTQLMRDPDYLRTLASAYSAVGRDGDAQKVLRSALDLPFPSGARGVQTETRLQYAALLQQANRLDQAAGLFRQVIATDPNNTSAWQGLVRVEHGMKQESQALQTLEHMPPASYEQAMRDPGFEATVASIYQAQNKPDIAQNILERAIAQQTSVGQRPSVGVETQLAGIYLSENNARQAYPLYRHILSENPNNTDAWLGLLNTLHSTGRDSEALAEIRQIPQPVRHTLESNVDYLQAVGNIYNGLGQPREAMQFLSRVQQHYTLQHSLPPADIDIQNAYLLFNGNNDTGLYRQLMVLGSRPDLTDEQRRTVQTIWSLWAVRRANQAAAAGSNKRALAILNAAAQAFPDNPGVERALAAGYARAGLPKQAVAIFKSQDMTSATASDYKSAVGAALAAGDKATAETWLRYGLNQYPRDAQMLILGAKFEQARGDNNRAAEYYRASLAAMPAPDPGAELADELSRPSQVAAASLPSASKPQDLASLLRPGSSDMALNTVPAEPPAPVHPYLPSFANEDGTAPVQIGSAGSTQQNALQSYGSQSATRSAVPSYMTNPVRKSTKGQTTLRDYAPPSALEQPAGGYAIPQEDAILQQGYQQQSAQQQPMTYPQQQQQSYGQQPNYLPGQTQYPAQPNNTYQAQPSYPTQMPNSYPSQNSQPTEGVPGTAQPYNVPQSSLPAMPPSSMNSAPMSTAGSSYRMSEQSYRQGQSGQPQQQGYPQTYPQDTYSVPGTNGANQQNGQSSQGGVPGVVYGPYVPYVPASSGLYAPSAVPVQLGAEQGTTNMPAQPEVTDVLPTARYVPNARASRNRSATRTNRMTGQSHPPADDTLDAPLVNTQYNQSQSVAQPPSQLGYQNQMPTPPEGQIPQPSYQQGSQYPPVQQQVPQQGYDPNSAVRAPSRSTRYDQSNGQTQRADDSYGQQYPQPRARTTRKPKRVQPSVTEQPGIVYPGVAQPLYVPSYPVEGDGTNTTRNGAVPTDADLASRLVPPLRGGYNAAVATPALSERDQTERDLATLVGSYSGWLGGTGFARYRSGTSGFDRLTDLEASFEASVVAAKSVRFTVVARPVFLSNGLIDSATFQAQTGGTIPVLGTLPANALTTPSQQYATGIGGEVQMTTTNFGLALGYSPYGFLVSNVTGRALWRPLGGHFTLFANRDTVNETQLSYAGLRDPGSATPFFAGNIWGGVVNTGGGARVDVGNERAGFYLSGDGGSLTGTHTLGNTKYEGTMGAYFRVHVWPGYGSLNVGATFFGMHYTYNELGLTYGLGGYFSPQTYFLAAVPISYTGHYKTNVHYLISGSIGLQTFKSDSEAYFPLDRAIETGANNASTPVTSNTGANYSVNSEGSYHITDHWYAGGFLAANNTNNYNTASGGFFIRYLFKPQVQTEEYPTGLFPVEGFRPLRVP